MLSVILIVVHNELLLIAHLDNDHDVTKGTDTSDELCPQYFE